MRYIKEFFRSIKNLFLYFKLIWSDRDWDYQYLLFILKFKITRMRKYAEKVTVNRVMNAQHQIKYMKLSEKMLDKIIEGDFSDKDFWKDDEHFWDPVENEPEFKQLRIESPHSEEERRNQILKEHNYETKYHKTFWHILEKRIRTWWD